MAATPWIPGSYWFFMHFMPRPHVKTSQRPAGLQFFAFKSRHRPHPTRRRPRRSWTPVRPGSPGSRSPSGPPRCRGRRWGRMWWRTGCWTASSSPSVRETTWRRDRRRPDLQLEVSSEDVPSWRTGGLSGWFSKTTADVLSSQHWRKPSNSFALLLFNNQKLSLNNRNKNKH